MYWISKSIHQVRRLNRRTVLFLAALGPGIITMIADNDAGGISTYAQTGAKTGFNLLWAMIILVPMAYYVQEMTVRLGAVTKRGHAEAIFDGFGKFWGWFSIFDLAVINWLTLVTEYIGMTQAMSLFNIPPWITFFGVTFLMLGIVISGRYWTFEKITLFFCLFNLVYIPAAIWAMHTGNVKEGWSAVGRGFYHPNFAFGMSGVALLTLIMANIGTTITPWQIFFQQSAVVDKGMDIKDIKYGKFDTFFGSFMTCVVAAFIIIATAGVFHFNPDQSQGYRDIDSAAKTAAAMPQVLHGQWGQWAKVLFAVGLFDAGLAGRALHFAGHKLGHGRGVRLGALPEQDRARGALVLCRLCADAHVRGRGVADRLRGCAEHHHHLRPGGGRDAAAGGVDVPHPAAQRQTAHGRARQHPLAEHRQLEHHRLCHCHLHRLRGFGAVSRVVRLGQLGGTANE